MNKIEQQIKKIFSVKTPRKTSKKKKRRKEEGEFPVLRLIELQELVANRGSDKELDCLAFIFFQNQLTKERFKSSLTFQICSSHRLGIENFEM